MKRTIVGVVVLLLAFSLFACSGGTDADDSGQSSDSEDSGGGEVTLTIGLPGGYALTQEEIFDSFADKHPEINLEVVESPWGDFVKQITTQVAGDTAPDMWFEENAKILGYGDRGAAEDLAPYIERDLDEDDYIDALFASETPDGEVYGVPHGINPIALAYNKSVFDDADVDYPSDDWTYEDMIEAAVEITQNTDDDIYGFTVGTNITQGWFPWIKAAGGQALDETLTKAMFADDPNTLKGITAWRDMIHELEVSPTSDFVEASDGQLLEKGMAAMNFFQYSSQRTVNENFPDLEWDTVKIPKGFDGNERVVPMVVNSWLIYSKSDQEVKDAGWEFLKHYLSEEVQMILAESGASLPVEKNSLEALEGMTDTKPYNKAAFTEGIAESGMMMDENPTWQEWRNEAAPVFEDIRDGITSPEEGLAEIQEKVQRVLDEG